MPLFEYECRECGSRFEHLTRAGESPACPSCHASDLQKLLSVFAVGGPSATDSFKSTAPGACGRCGDPRGPGACSLN